MKVLQLSHHGYRGHYGHDGEEKNVIEPPRSGTRFTINRIERIYLHFIDP